MGETAVLERAIVPSAQTRLVPLSSAFTPWLLRQMLSKIVTSAPPKAGRTRLSTSYAVFIIVWHRTTASSEVNFVIFLS